MGLHAISADSTQLSYHCVNPHCSFHNCAAWEPFQQCAAHDTYQYITVPAAEMRQRMAGLVSPVVLAKMGDTIMMDRVQQRIAGQTHQVQITDPGIQWTGPDVVALPVCGGLDSVTGQACGTRMFLKVNFTAAELAAPNMQIATRDPQNPSVITSLTQHPMVARHQQLAAKLTSMGVVWTPPQ